VPACGNLSSGAFSTILEWQTAVVKMSISASISRLSAYYTRHGFGATIRRAGLAARRALLSGRTVLFCCDLSTQGSLILDLPDFLKVDRCINEGELSLRDLQDIISFWNPKLAGRNIKQRFGQGASLWLIKFKGKLAGYGWTLQGQTVEPHYFRLGPDDVHLFDFHVFPQYRGRGLNPLLVNFILANQSAERRGRAYIEAAEWNQAQLSSLRRTPFHRFGSARKFTILRRTIVRWSEKKTEQPGQGGEAIIAPVTASGCEAPVVADLRARSRVNIQGFGG
jgi:ribosomal protein S18 acetylase RimI-like enzyme